MAPLLDVSGLNVAVSVRGQDARLVLQDITFAVNTGEIVGVIGEAGSGKSVLARALVQAISAPLHVTGGSILFHGNDILRSNSAQLRQIRGNQIGYIGANPMGSLDPRTAIGTQLIEKLRAVRPDVRRAEAREKVLETLAAVRIPSPAARFHEYPFQFSGGMMQRVMIVDALLTDPSLLIADNITQPLDVTVAAQIISLIRELRDKLGMAIVFISSSLPIVAKTAERAIVLHRSRIVEQSETQDLIAKPRHAYTRQLIAKLPKIWSEDGQSTEPPAEEAPILAVRDVSKTYRVHKRGTFRQFNAVKAVRGVSLDLRAGENLGIVGESGCGKSTLTRLLAWLERPDAGQILFDGKDLAALAPRALIEMRKSFQLLLQDPYGSLPSGVSVGRLIAEPLRIHGVGSAQSERRVKQAMDEVGLPRDLIHSLPVGLSAGQRQRINIARALVLQPKLLILDETLSALDQIEQTELLALFMRLQHDHNLSYIFISHDIALVRKVCHRIAVMYLGKVVELADNAAMFASPQHPYTRALLSAVPTIERNPLSGAEYVVDGEPPSPIDLPQGCTFWSRCPIRTAHCRSAEPPLIVDGSGGKAACFYAGSRPPMNAEFAHNAR